MKCRITFQGGFGMHEDARDRFASIIVDVPENIAKMCNERGASYSHVVATEWMTEDEKNDCIEVIFLLVEYHNNVFNAAIQGDKVHIWKYVPADGLKKTQTRRGIDCYERYVSKDEISRPFSVSFFAVKGNRKYTITSVIGGKMTIMCDDQEFAATMGFQETEHGVWVKSMDISSFESFVIVKYVQNSSDRIVRNLDRTEMITCWKKYVKDVSI